MGWSITGDLEQYRAEVGDFLRADPGENTVLISVAETLRERGVDAYGGGARFGWWRSDDGAIQGAFQHTPPLPVLMSAMPEQAAGELAAMLADQNVSLSGVTGSQETAEAFANTWRSRTGASTNVAMRQRLYRLARLDPPDPIPVGMSRVANPADRDLVLAWFEEFGREAHDPGSGVPVLVDDKIGYGGVLLWEVDGDPVSMAARTRVLSDMARVAPVYTPPENRRRGYGAAVTAALTQSALDAGARQIVLFTDLANPTSNSIYQRLGFLGVSDRLSLSF